jgi:hypothetical protein
MSFAVRVRRYGGLKIAKVRLTIWLQYNIENYMNNIRLYVR